MHWAKLKHLSGHVSMAMAPPPLVLALKERPVDEGIHLNFPVQGTGHLVIFQQRFCLPVSTHLYGRH